MLFDQQEYDRLVGELKAYNASLIAVSKTKQVEAIAALHEYGQQAFGENYVLELQSKSLLLPGSIQWHYIGHLQTNKVKSIAPFVHLIQTVDSMKLLKEINKYALKNQRIIHCLLQIHIAAEETKFGLSYDEANELLQNMANADLGHVCIKGLMGMASLTDDENKIGSEFRELRKYFESTYSGFASAIIRPEILSMGMSGDYKIALQEGSTMIRIGTAIFGERTRP